MDQYFHVVLFIMLYKVCKVVLTFKLKYVDETLVCYIVWPFNVIYSVVGLCITQIADCELQTYMLIFHL